MSMKALSFTILLSMLCATGPRPAVSAEVPSQSPEQAPGTEVVKTPAQEVHFSLSAGGKIERWLVGGRDLSAAGRLCPFSDGFSASSVQLVSREQTNSQVRLVFKRDCLPGMDGLQTYLVSMTDASIRVKYQLTNRSDKPISFRFMTTSRPLLGEKERKESNEGGNGLHLLVPVPGGIEVTTPFEFLSVDGMAVYSTPRASLDPGYFVNSFATILAGRLGQYCPASREAVVYEFDVSRLLQLFVYVGDPVTMQWKYKSATLAPGNSWEAEVTLKCLKDATAESVKRIVEGVRDGGNKD